jgi:divalent metal cation (Fe/Co/Zn/Cd) transporter
MASIGIGLILLVSSLLLARETKDLLIGEPARPGLRDAILRIAADDRDVMHANGALTVHLGPHQIVAALSIEFREELGTNQIEDCVERIEAAIKHALPEVTSLFVKPQNAETWRARAAALNSTPSDH